MIVNGSVTTSGGSFIAGNESQSPPARRCGLPGRRGWPRSSRKLLQQSHARLQQAAPRIGCPRQA